MKNRLFFCLLFMVFGWLQAQLPGTIHLSEKDGLPDIEFYDMIEDSKGFIWLAADTGLYRYDGKEFKNYTNDEKRGLSVFELFEDEQGRIWCTNIAGQFFYVENDVLVTFIDLSEELKGSLSNFIIQDGNLKVFYLKGIYEVNLETKQYEKTLPHKSLGFGFPIIFKKSVYIQNGLTIVRQTSKGDFQEIFEVDENDNSGLYEASLGQGRSTLFTNGEQLFFHKEFRGENRFFLLDIDNNRIVPVAAPSALLNKRIIKVSLIDNMLWFGTNSGAYSCTYKNGKFHYQNGYLEDQMVTKVVSDKDENFWFTTLREGVFVIPNINVGLYPLPTDLTNISCLEKTGEQTVSFGTVNGNLIEYNLQGKKLRELQLPSKTKVTAIEFNSKTNTTYASLGAMGYIVDQKERSYLEIPSLANTKAIASLPNAILYTSYFGARIAENPFEESPGTMSQLSEKRGYSCFYIPETKTAYVSYVDNLVRYDSLWNSVDITHKNRPIFAIDMTKTEDGILWVSTFKEGIIAIKNDSVIANYTEEDGLISNQVSKLQSDGVNLWLATDKGIQFFDREKITFKALTKVDGIPSYKISGISVFEDEVIFSSNLGLFGVDKITSFRSRPIPKVYLTKVAIAERDTLILDQYDLPHDKNRLRFEFRANSFQASENINYQYRLNGADAPWVTLEKGVDNLELSNLADGSYSLEIRAKNSYGSDVSGTKTVAFTIALPFWERWWFISLVVVLAVLLTFLYFENLIKRREINRRLEFEKLESEKELASLKLENLRSQMNPHFIFNALSSIQHFILTNKSREASNYLGDFADLIRGYLDSSVNDVISIKDEIEALNTYLHLEKMRFEDSFNYALDFSEETRAEGLYIPTMLLQPYIENAIKHGLMHKREEKFLQINGSITNDKQTQSRLLLCEIIDNGIGREKSKTLDNNAKKRHTSFATKATENRLSLLAYRNGMQIGVETIDLKNEDGSSNGTKVILTIPIEET